MKRYKVVIWDWNGTLADDVGASLLATNDILKNHGKAPIDMVQYYEYIDTPISRFYAHLFDLDEVPMSVIGPEFSEYYPKYFEGLHKGAGRLLRTLQTALRGTRNGLRFCRILKRFWRRMICWREARWSGERPGSKARRSTREIW